MNKAHETRVVYVDDEPTLCRVFALVLTRAGYSVTTFTNPAEALTYLETEPADIVVCDQRMPEMTGLEFLARLRANVRFFMVSGEIDAIDLGQADPRVKGVLAKPFRPEDLLALIGPPSDEHE